MRTRLLPLVFLATTLTSAAHAQKVLYSASSGQTISQFGGWTSFVPTPATEAFNGTASVLSTSASNAVQAGYSRNDNTLSRAGGYQLNFTLKVDDETHDGTNGANRAGVSVIALSSDLLGVELSFWTDRVWAQSISGTTFTKAEEGLFNTTSALNSYSLVVAGSNYSLFVNGQALPLVSGALRNYSAAGAPYTVANFIFFGDDTTSARGTAQISSITLSTAPEPGTAGLVAPGLLCLVSTIRGYRRRRNI